MASICVDNPIVVKGIQHMTTEECISELFYRGDEVRLIASS